CPDDHLFAQRVLVTDRLQRLASLGALFDRSGARSRRRVLKLGTKRPVELHDRLLGLGTRGGLSVADVNWRAQIDRPFSRVAGRTRRRPIGGDIASELLDGAQPDPDKNG